MISAPSTLPLSRRSRCRNWRKFRGNSLPFARPEGGRFTENVAVMVALTAVVSVILAGLLVAVTWMAHSQWGFVALAFWMVAVVAVVTPWIDGD